jgi:hypothetical protein
MEKPVFAPSFFEELAIDNPLGANLTTAEVEAWWHFIAWPRYKTYRYRAHKRALRKWWAGISMSDISRAREAMERSKVAAAQARQDEIADAGVPWQDTAVYDALSTIFGN